MQVKFLKVPAMSNTKAQFDINIRMANDKIQFSLFMFNRFIIIKKWSSNMFQKIYLN